MNYHMHCTDYWLVKYIYIHFLLLYFFSISNSLLLSLLATSIYPQIHVYAYNNGRWKMFFPPQKWQRIPRKKPWIQVSHPQKSWVLINLHPTPLQKKSLLATKNLWRTQKALLKNLICDGKIKPSQILDKM